jgi:hypothetical protein
VVIATTVVATRAAIRIRPVVVGVVASSFVFVPRVVAVVVTPCDESVSAFPASAPPAASRMKAARPITSLPMSPPLVMATGWRNPAQARATREENLG